MSNNRSKKQSNEKKSHSACYLPVVKHVATKPSKIPPVVKDVATKPSKIPLLKNSAVKDAPRDISDLKESLVQLKQDHKATNSIVGDLKESFDKLAPQLSSIIEGKFFELFS